MLKIKNKCVNTIIIITSSQGLEHKHRNSYGNSYDFSKASFYSTFILQNVHDGQPICAIKLRAFIG